MKTLLIILTALIMVACGTDNKHFKLEGRLLHLNQGEFYIYSPDGELDGVDTLKVQAGRFALEVPCTKPMRLMLIFPNFTEQPIFAEPGKTVKIQGDASHLSEMEVTGTEDNELMTAFRQRIAKQSPPEIRKIAEETILRNPASAVSEYLLRTYMMTEYAYDATKADALLQAMLRSRPNDVRLKRLRQEAALFRAMQKGSPLPAFTMTDTEGKTLSHKMFAQSPVLVVYTWSASNYDSRSFQTRLRNRVLSDSRIKAIGICVDPDLRSCRQNLHTELLPWSVVCDERMLDGAARIFRLQSIPDNAVYRQGKLIGHSMSYDELDKLISSSLTP